jgi:hypothetical protein
MLPLQPVMLRLCWRTRSTWAATTMSAWTSDYSVDPATIGRLVGVSADLDRVRVGERVVTHHRRSWAGRQTITSPVHTTARSRALAP